MLIGSNIMMVQHTVVAVCMYVCMCVRARACVCACVRLFPCLFKVFVLTTTL